MASKSEIDFSYSTMDKIWRLSMGEYADFTGAKYDGDYSISLEEAQKRKHDFISSHLEIESGKKVLDIGCGWGPVLNHIRELDAEGVGITLSDGQYHACRRNGLEVHVCNYRDLNQETFGTFDAVVSVGAFEHFCSVEEYKNGHQDKVYDDFFRTVCDLLPPGGRCFIQTMVFGEGMIPIEHFDINAPKDSNEYLMALVMNEFPGSWLPYGKQHVIQSASPYFDLVTEHSGRLDYIETIKEWRKRLKKFGVQKYMAYASLIPQFLMDVKLRRRLDNLKIAPIRVAFEREIWDHHRFIFEKRAEA